MSPIISLLYPEPQKDSGSTPSLDLTVGELSSVRLEKKETNNQGAIAMYQYSEIYDPAKVIVKSSAFKNKSVLVNPYLYNGGIYFSYLINASDKITANIWIMDLTNSDNKNSSDNYVIFPSYENYTLKPQNVLNSPKDKGQYENQNGLTFYWIYDFGPKVPWADLCLQTDTISPASKSIYIRSCKEISSNPVSSYDIPLDIHKQDLIKFADTLDL